VAPLRISPETVYSSFVMLQSIYYPFYFCFIVLYVLLTIFLFCNMKYFSLCILLFAPFMQKGLLPAGGNPIAVYKYRTVS